MERKRVEKQDQEAEFLGLKAAGRGRHGPSGPAVPVQAGNQAVLQQVAAGRPDTGIPRSLKARVEAHAGVSLDDVKVHYRSENPAKVGALAYTQGSQVYIGPGQEHHLSHELGHVVQQKQGRVRPNGTAGGQPLNDDASLEREADSYRQF